MSSSQVLKLSCTILYPYLHTPTNIRIFQIFFGDLPNELVELTMSFVKSNRIKRLARTVCRTWFNCIIETPFDIYLPLPSEIPQIAKMLKRCHKPFSLKVHKADKLSSENYRKLLSNMKNIVSFEVSFAHRKFNFQAGSVDLDQLTNLQRFSAPHISVSASVILPCLTHLEALEVNFADPNCFPNLEFFSSKSQRPFAKHPILPKLTTLKYDQDIFGPKVSNYIQNMKVFLPPTLSFQLPAFSLPNLEELKLGSQTLKFLACNNLTKLSIDGVKDFLPLKVVTNLLELDVEHASSIKENSLSFLTSFKQLNSFQIWLYQYTAYSGEFLKFLNPKTLTRLTAGISAENISNHITKFTNLESLTLWIEVKADINSLSSLSRLTALSVMGSDSGLDLFWVSKLTELKQIYLAFKSDLKSPPLDLDHMTNLTSLHVHSLKTLQAMPNLTNLRKLEFATANEYTFISKLTKLTRLNCARSAVADQVTNLHKIRKLEISFSSNEQIMALTGLQKLTHLMAKASSDQVRVDTLTLLTRLQSVSFGSTGLLLNCAVPWKESTAVPEVAQKLPRLVLKPNI